MPPPPPFKSLLLKKTPRANKVCWLINTLGEPKLPQYYYSSPEPSISSASTGASAALLVLRRPGSANLLLSFIVTETPHPWLVIQAKAWDTHRCLFIQLRWKPKGKPVQKEGWTKSGQMSLQYNMKRLKSSMILGKLLSKSFPQAIPKSLCCPFKWGRAKKKSCKAKGFLWNPLAKDPFFLSGKNRNPQRHTMGVTVPIAASHPHLPPSRISALQAQFELLPTLK